MTVELLFLLLFIAFSFMLNILFYAKKHVDTKETRLFGLISLVNMIGLVVEFASIYSAKSLGIENTITIVISKCYLVYLLGF